MRKESINNTAKNHRFPDKDRPENILNAIEAIEGIIRRATGADEVLDRVLVAVRDIFQCDRAWLFYPCNTGVADFEVSYESAVGAYPGANALDGPDGSKGAGQKQVGHQRQRQVGK